MIIPKPEDEPSINPIPKTAAEVSQTAEAPEAKPVLISFERYNSGECQLNGMESKMAKKALRVVRGECRGWTPFRSGTQNDKVMTVDATVF